MDKIYSAYLFAYTRTMAGQDITPPADIGHLLAVCLGQLHAKQGKEPQSYRETCIDMDKCHGHSEAPPK